MKISKIIIYIGLSVLAVLVIAFIAYSYITYNKASKNTEQAQDEQETETDTASPTTGELPTEESATTETAEVVADTPEYTGANDDDTENIQSTDYLIDKLPITNDRFTILYSYNDLTFYIQMNAQENTPAAEEYLNEVKSIIAENELTLDNMTYEIIYKTN